jgi:hypothetical protein
LLAITNRGIEHPDCHDSLYDNKPPDGSGSAILSDKAPSGTSSVGGIDRQQDDDSAKHKHGTSGGCDPRNPSTKSRVEVYERFVTITGRHICASYESRHVSSFSLDARFHDKPAHDVHTRFDINGIWLSTCNCRPRADDGNGDVA